MNGTKLTLSRAEKNKIKKNIMRIEFLGNVTVAHMLECEQKLEMAIASLEGKTFHVLCIMDAALDKEKAAILGRMQVYAKTKGLLYSVVFAESIQTKVSKRTADKTGVFETEIYVDINDSKRFEKAEHFFKYGQEK